MTATLAPITTVHPDPDNIRRNVDADKAAFAELVASIEAVGIVESLVVVPHPTIDGEWQLVAGHRRRAAAEKAGLDQVPIDVRDLTAEQIIEVQLIENLQRADLDPVEEARAYFRLVEIGMDTDTLARRIGRPKRHVTDRIKLLELPEKALDKVADGSLGVGDAQHLAKVAGDVAVVDEAVKRICARNHYGSVEQTVRNVKDELASKAKVAKAVEAAKAKGWKVARKKSYSDPPEAKGWKRTKHSSEWQTNGLWANGTTARKHEKEPCHAVLIEEYYRCEVIPHCTDPKRHTVRGESDLRADPRPKGPAGPKKSTAEQKAEAAQQEAIAARDAWIAEWLNAPGPITPAEGARLAVELLLLDGIHFYEDDMKGALKLLGAEAPKDADHGWANARVAERVEQGSQAERHLLVLATWCADQMHTVKRLTGWVSDDTIRWYRFLRDHGYQLHPAEVEHLGDRIDPPADPAA